MGHKQIQNLKIVNQATNKVVLLLPIDADMTAAALLIIYAGMIGLPANSHGALTRKLTRQQLLPTQTLGMADVENDETLIADMEMVPGGLLPVSLLENLTLSYKILKEHIASNCIWMLILYDDTNPNLVGYIRTWIEMLHEMSGNSCHFYVIERLKTSKERQRITKYWESQLGEYYADAAYYLELGRSTPIEHSLAYQVAHAFEVEDKQIPCLVFWEDMNSTVKLMYEIRGVNLKDADASQEELTVFLYSKSFKRDGWQTSFES